MPTVLRLGALRVVVYPNDHRRAHVHVIGGGCEAVFRLNCPAGPVDLVRITAFHSVKPPGSQPNYSIGWRNYAANGSGSMASQDEFANAVKRAERRLRTGTLAVAARYDRRSKRIVIRLSSGLDIAFAPRDAQGLQNAKPDQLNLIEISPSGLGIHLPKLDADLYLPALLEGLLGSREWMAARLGAHGGKATSPAKISAARANGRLGGRPKKIKAGAVNPVSPRSR
jgi:hypothetical protein